MKSRLLLASSLTAGLAFALGSGVSCGSSVTNTPAACAPGQSPACTGATGCSGHQVCKSDGSGYEPCTCDSSPESGPDGKTPGDATPAGDAPLDHANGDAGPHDAAMCPEAGETRCGSACTSLQTDPANCGTCSHACTPGTCSAGVCQPFTLAADPAGASILAVVDGRATWGNYMTGYVRTCLVDSCTPVDFAMGSVVSGIAMDSKNIYWGEQIASGNVTECAIGASCVSPVVLGSSQSQPWYVTTDSTNVYWTDFTGGTIESCPIAGCSTEPTQLATGQGSPIGLAVDSKNLYWTNYNGGDVMQCAKTGCGGTPTTLATGQMNPYGITVTATNVYWAQQTGGSLMMCAIGGCASTPTAIVTGINGPVQLTVDDTDLYWTETGMVMRCALPDCTSPMVVASGQMEPFGIAVDATRIYWDNQAGGQVMGVAK
jgi:hypothetical protein